MNISSRAYRNLPFELRLIHCLYGRPPFDITGIPTHATLRECDTTMTPFGDYIHDFDHLEHNVLKALHTLDDRALCIINLHVRDQFSFSRIARSLDLSTTRVIDFFHNALQDLRYTGLLTLASEHERQEAARTAEMTLEQALLDEKAQALPLIRHALSNTRPAFARIASPDMRIEDLVLTSRAKNLMGGGPSPEAWTRHTVADFLARYPYDPSKNLFCNFHHDYPSIGVWHLEIWSRLYLDGYLGQDQRFCKFYYMSCDQRSLTPGSRYLSIVDFCPSLSSRARNVLARLHVDNIEDFKRTLGHDRQHAEKRLLRAQQCGDCTARELIAAYLSAGYHF